MEMHVPTPRARGPASPTNLVNAIFPGRRMGTFPSIFRQGFNAIVKMWLLGGCRETPEDMAQIIRSESRGRMGP